MAGQNNERIKLNMRNRPGVRERTVSQTPGGGGGGKREGLGTMGVTTQLSHPSRVGGQVSVCGNQGKD